MNGKFFFASQLLALFLGGYILAQTNPNASYTVPVFTDSKRVEKIKSLAPIIQKMIDDYAVANHFPGYSFGVIADGELIVSGSNGYTDLSRKTPVNTQSMFRIASMSKSFTAMAITQLRDEGKISLDDHVSKYIPAIKNQGLTKDASEITIRQLMTHSAGFPEDNPWGDRQLADTDEELIDLIKKGIPFSNVNGTNYEYSNLGFAMLGYIIKKVTGIPYSAYIQQKIWNKLKMKASWEYSTVSEKEYAKGYRWINNQWKEEIPLHDGIFGAMGGMITSVESFCKYMSMHLAAWPASNEKDHIVLRRSSSREMQQPWRFNSLNASFKYPDGRTCPTVTGYGYGLAILRDCENKLMVGHSGGLPGFGSNWRILPDYGIGIVLLANVTYAPAAAINLSVIDTIVKLAGLQPRQLPPSAILNQRKNELVKLLPNFTHAEKSGIFAENFFLDYFTDSLSKEANSHFDQLGALVSIGALIPENQLRGSFIMEFQKGKIKISFTLTPENPGLIQEYHLTKMK